MTSRGVKQTLRKQAEYAAARFASLVPGQAFVRDLALRRLRQTTKAFTSAELAASALVVAPHPDDETLGCGGMIALKRRHGASVSVVVLSDGGRSHAFSTQKAEYADLAAQRASECEAALACLGVPNSNVMQLGLPDGNLTHQQTEGAAALLRIIERLRPAQLFVPHLDEPPEDHRAAHRIALAGLAQTSVRPAVFAYPVWLWQQWPWVPIDKDRALGHEVLVASWRACFGLQWLSQFDRAVQTHDVVALKRQALAAYQSQMQRPQGHAHWSTLADVSGGQFLRCFFEGIEPFQTLYVGG